MMTSLACRSILTRTATARQCRLHPVTIDNKNNHCSSLFFSTSPDYANYETWHHDNYEDAEINVNDSDGLQQAHDAGIFQRDENGVKNNKAFPLEGPRTSVLMELTDSVGALHDVLRFFWKYNVNITRIESRPVNHNQDSKPKFDFFVDFHGKVGDDNVNALLQELKGVTDKLLILDEKEVHWFPRHVSELDLIANRTLDAGTDLEADHLNFHDAEYRKRRGKLAELALNRIRKTEYTKEDVETWGLVWDTMEDLWDKVSVEDILGTAIKNM